MKTQRTMEIILYIFEIIFCNYHRVLNQFLVVNQHLGVTFLLVFVSSSPFLNQNRAKKLRKQ